MSYPELQPERAVLMLPMRSSFDMPVGANLITGDPYDPLTWNIGNNAALSRQVGVYLGGDALRVTENGVAGAYASRAVLTIGKRYRLSATMRNNGATYAQTVCTNTLGIVTLPAFVPVTTDFTASSTSFRLAIATVGGFTLSGDFAALSLYELRRVTSNLGTAAGAPATVQLGDGFSLASMPTQLYPRGFSFDGSSDYLDAGQAGATLTDNFTMYVCDSMLGMGVQHALISRFDGANYQWFLQSTNGNLRMMYDGAGSFPGTYNYNLSRTTTVTAYTVRSGVGQHYRNGNPDGAAHSPTFVARPGASTIIGQRSSAGSFRYQGAIYSVALFPEPHSQQTVREMTRRMRQNRMIP